MRTDSLRPSPTLILKIAASLVCVGAFLFPYFNLEVPTELHDVDSGILDPRDTYADPGEWDQKAKKLSELFIANFEQFTDNEEGKALVAAGPQL